MTPSPGPGWPPPQVRLATTLLLGVGGLLVVSGALVFVVRGRIADSVVDTAREQAAREQAAGGQAVDLPNRTDLVTSLAVVGAIFVGIGAAALLAGCYVRGRRTWARLAGIAVGVLLGVVGVQSLLGGGSLLALLLPIAAIGVAVTIVASLLSRQTAAWFRGEQLRGEHSA